MRMIIKGADFSSVSIGKVVKDISFAISLTNDNVSDFLLNPPSVELTSEVLAASTSNNDGTTIYQGAKTGSTITTSANNKYRWVSDFIEVLEGMTIDLSLWRQGTSTDDPLLICFDSSKNVMNQPNGVWKQDYQTLYNIPSGCKFIKFQNTQIKIGSAIRGLMPEL